MNKSIAPAGERPEGADSHRRGRCKVELPEEREEGEMYARVARFEGADVEAMTNSAAEIRAQAESEGEPPPGLPAKEFLLLHDTAAGKSLAITLFEGEDDYHQGDGTLNSMSPPGEGMGRRASVERYELVAHVEA